MNSLQQYWSTDPRPGPAPGEAAVLGIDIGGTKLAAGAVSPDGEVLAYQRIVTPKDQDAEGLLGTVVELAGAVRSQCSAPVAAVGIGCGGPMLFPEGVVSPLHIPCWRDFPLRARLAEIFKLPTVLDNDANAFALGESRFGAGRGARALLGMVVSTGVGGGVVEGGRLYHGASGNAGHIGHTIISLGGPRCECGARGCLTAYASGTGLAARARAALGRGVSSSMAQVAEAEIGGREIAAAARAGDPLAVRLMGDASMALSRAIFDAAYVLDLDRVVLGGGLMTGAGDILLARLRARVAQRPRLPFLRELRITGATLGERSGVIGAAALVIASW
ncbi:MAG: ROK family protein [Ktedonobacterales bacterium]